MAKKLRFPLSRVPAESNPFRLPLDLLSRLGRTEAKPPDANAYSSLEPACVMASGVQFRV